MGWPLSVPGFVAEGSWYLHLLHDDPWGSTVKSDRQELENLLEAPRARSRLLGPGWGRWKPAQPVFILFNPVPLGLAPKSILFCSWRQTKKQILT